MARSAARLATSRALIRARELKLAHCAVWAIDAGRALIRARELKPLLRLLYKNTVLVAP